MKFCWVYQPKEWMSDYKSQFNLGILALNTILKKNKIKTSFFDCNLQPISELEEFDIYAFSATYKDYPNTLKVAREIRQKNSEAKIILGGIHPTTCWFSEQKLLNESELFDSIFIGEAENQLIHFLNDFPSVKPTYIENNPECIDINQQIDRSLVDETYIISEDIFPGRRERGVSILLSRGCPYQCTFCSSSLFYKRRVRFRSIESISEELDLLVDKYRVKLVRVQDDTFTINKKFMMDVTEEFAKRGLKYRISTRINHINEEILSTLSKTGCIEVGYGIECADDEVLQRLRKGITVAQVEDVLIKTKKHGISTRGFFMVGLPWDNKEIFEKNKNLIKRTQIDFIRWGCFYPFPGTEIRANAKKHGIIKIADNCNFLIGHEGPLPPNIWLEHMDYNYHYELIKDMWYWLENYIREKEREKTNMH